MKTLVIVSIPGSVLSLELSDFPTGGPLEGRIYEFEGKLYKVTEITETLGSRGLQGNKISGDMRLLQFADAICNGDEALKQQIMKSKKVGKSGPEEVVSAGGIILAGEEKPKLELGEQFDHIMFVKAVPSDSFRVARGMRLAEAAIGPVSDRLIGAANDEQLQVASTGSGS